jgi:2-hydroxy-6-oxonona-2,4-dienedioate hydrolase
MHEGGSLIFSQYRNEMRAARERLSTGSQIIQTRYGPFEYAEAGDGYPVLVVHGAGGGFNQGLILAEAMVHEGFRLISPSSFGFLRTPIPRNPSCTSSADALADLLDTLNIKKAAVVGFSAGGPSVLHFALRHPERTTAIVLLSAVVHKEKPMDAREKIIHYGIFGSDFLFWLIAKYFEPNLISFLGVTPEVQATLTPREKHWLSNVILPSMHPISQRQVGMVNDRKNFSFLEYSLTQITTPSLIIYARDDTLVSPSHSLYAAREIPNAKLVTLESGGHMLIGHHERVAQEVAGFLWQQVHGEKDVCVL